MRKSIAMNGRVCYNKTMLELLAPAGDMSALDTAIKSGADAVYLGLDGFNARMKAQNFNADNIGDVVAYAHFYGVKVYVTINTIVQNSEFNDLISLVKTAVAAKVDAFLVQDLGVAKLLNDTFDGIVLHASTQMGIHNLQGARVAERIGIKRVVLSRETKLEDIENIRKNTSLEIEYFVQGALCVAFSGNCYLSSVEQGASGNRGLCKQLCRLAYTSRSGGKADNGYMLSARDLCLAKSVKQLADAGVCSFKIEGRLRRNGYVAEAVQAYRKIIDEVENGQKIDFDDKDENRLKIAFSRGDFLERAYLDDGVPKVIEKRYNNHTGIKVGVVKDVKPFKNDLYEIVVSSNRRLNKGDGVKFFDKEKESASLGIGEAREKGKGHYGIITTAKVKVGWEVRLISDACREKELQDAKRFVPVKFEVQALSGKPLRIVAASVRSGVEISASKESSEELQKAINAPTGEEEIAKQCGKTGDSGFCTDEVKTITDGVFVAKSVLNGLRRDVLDELKRKITDFEKPQSVRINEDKLARELQKSNDCKRIDSPPVKIVDAESENKSLFLKKGDKVAIRPSVWSADAIKRTLALLDLKQEDIALDLPIVANGKDVDVIKKTLAELKGVKTLVSENVYGLDFAKDGYTVVAGQGHNIANTFAVEAVKALGAAAYVPSLEYPLFEAQDVLARLDTDKNIPLMTFAHCPYKTMFGNDCDKCSYKGDMTMQREKHIYKVRRVRVSQCYFALYPEK